MTDTAAPPKRIKGTLKRDLQDLLASPATQAELRRLSALAQARVLAPKLGCHYQSAYALLRAGVRPTRK